MKYTVPSVCLLLLAGTASAQFHIDKPEVNTPQFPITYIVYMAPNGNDNNPGTSDLPVKTFSRALELIPFRGPGQSTYGLVRLLPGVYYTMTGFQQSHSQWKEPTGALKNVSIEGIGNVIIRGPSKNNFANGHLIHLAGSHIFIRNLKLMYGDIHGVLISSWDNSRVTDVLIENVEVDSVKGFGMLFTRVDRVEVSHCAARYSARPGQQNLPAPCSYPSGIKFLGCTHATIHDSEIAYTRGEGLNFHNSMYGEAYRNELHDNPQQFYCDNSSRLLIHQNHLYNTPSLGKRYWTTCPVDTNELEWSGGAFLIANEGACVSGIWPTFENCNTICRTPDEVFPNVDSVFIYNNFVQKTGRFLDFWQGNLNVVGVNCIRNVFVWHNTFIELWGMPKPGNKAALVHFYFSDRPLLSYGTIQNVRIKHNIFAFDPDLANPLVEAKHPWIPELDYLLDANLWSIRPSFGPKVLTNNRESPDMPQTMPIIDCSRGTATRDMICNAFGHYLIMTPENGVMPAIDFFGLPRPKEGYTIGAVECQEVVAQRAPVVGRMRVYPVPVRDWLHIDVGPDLLQTDFTVEVYHSTGQLVETAKNTTQLACGHLPIGFYTLVVRSKDWTLREVFVKAP